jgi:hypothetical protein
MYLNLLRCGYLLAALCTLSASSFSETPNSCSNATLAGAYGYSVHGTNLQAKVDFAMVGNFEADGQGSFSGTESDSVNGRVAHGPFTGTYIIRPDCSGSAKLKFQKSNVEALLDFVVVSNGNEMYIIDVGGGNIEFGEGKRQFRKSNE